MGGRQPGTPREGNAAAAAGGRAIAAAKPVSVRSSGRAPATIIRRPAGNAGSAVQPPPRRGDRAAWANRLLKEERRAEAAHAIIAEKRLALVEHQRRRGEADRLRQMHAAELAEAEDSHPPRMQKLQELEASLRESLAMAQAGIADEQQKRREMLIVLEAKVREVQARHARLTALEAQHAQQGAEWAELAGRARVAREAKAKAKTKEDAWNQLLAENVLLARRLHNEYLSLKGNIRVFCRVRPPLPSEEGELLRLDLGEDTIAVHSGPQRNVTGLSEHSNSWDFSFDQVFAHDSAQADVFDEISLLVQSALDGYRVAIFAYGQTGSGKTYTMQGPPGERSAAGVENTGMIPRAVDLVFAEVEALRKSGWIFEVQVTLLEIYNEAINDLLSASASAGGAASSSALASSAPAPLPNPSCPAGRDGWLTAQQPDGVGRCDTGGGASLPQQRSAGELGLPPSHRESATDAATVHSLLRRAMRERHTAATLSNDRSSRSHAVLQLSLVGRCEVEGCRRDVEGLLSFVDLAGSERVEKSGATGERLREAQHINRSLSALGDVVEALAKRGQGSKNCGQHVPYRNSRLTRLLKDSLGGDSKALMFVNISPHLEHLGETLSSLRFASKVHGCNVGVARRHLTDGGGGGPPRGPP